MPTVSIHWFARLRERRGLDHETVTCAAASAADLYAELARMHPLGLDRASVAVAINEALCPWDTPIADGDTVVFLPPVSGG